MSSNRPGSLPGSFSNTVVQGDQARVIAISRGLLNLTIASLAFMRPALPVATLRMNATDLLAGLAGASWLLACLIGRRWPRWDGFHVLLLGYFAAMTLSALVAARPPATFIVKLASEAYLIGLPVMMADLVADEHHLRRAVQAWLMGTAAVVVMTACALSVALIDPHNPALALVQHHLGSLPLGGLVRYRLAYENPNMLGAYLTVSLLVILLSAARGWINAGPAAILIAGVSMALVATFSAGIGGAIGAGAIWFWRGHRAERPRLAGTLLATGAAVGAAFVLAQAFTPVAYPQPLFRLPLPGTAFALFPSSRMRVWIDAWHSFINHPLTGVGVGADVAHVRFVEPGGAHPLLRDAHNVLLDVAASYGLIGAIAMGALIVAIWRRTWTAGDRADGLAAFAFGSGVLNVLVYQGFGGAFEDARFVWVGLGLLLAATRLDTAEDVAAANARRAGFR